VTNKWFPLATCCSLITATQAQAQSIHQEMYWRAASKPVKINTSIPASCDTPTANAAATINGMGVKFQLTGSGTYFTSNYITASGDPDFVNIQDASGLGVIMRTQFYYYDNPSGPDEAIDALVLVNGDRLYYGTETLQSTDFYCDAYVPSAGIGQRTDYQSAMLHEFGHVIGMGHRTDGTTGPCLMTQYLRSGEVKRSYCPDERGLMLGFYGAR